jgi:hypothetical protein
MAEFRYRFGSPSRSLDKSQPRRLTLSDPSHQCSWTGCSAKAVSAHKDKV